MHARGKSVTYSRMQPLASIFVVATLAYVDPSANFTAFLGFVLVK